MANKKLALKCAQGKKKKSDKKIEGVSQVYEVTTRKKTLLYWNSSNLEAIRDHDRVLRDISEKITQADYSTVNDGFNEIMFEIEFN